MACAALKRSSDWETINQSPHKRRRCNPFEGHPARLRIKKRLAANTNPSEIGKNSMIGQKRRNPFTEVNIPVMTSEKVSQNICDEIVRINKRRKLSICAPTSESTNDSELTGSELITDNYIPGLNEVPTPTVVISSNSEKPLFTFQQVRMICERMLREREEELCEKYNSMLTTKLAEQYDMFVKFTYDQIQKRYNSVPSYLS